jgi:hypothetical protein
MMDGPIGRALDHVLAGNTDAMALLESSTPDELSAVAVADELVLTRDATVRLLQRYSAGQIAAADAQRWASFVRRGYVAGGHSNPVRPLDIIFESGYESSISAAVGRLDELGDLVDGSLHEDEIEDLLGALGATVS